MNIAVSTPLFPAAQRQIHSPTAQRQTHGPAAQRQTHGPTAQRQSRDTAAGGSALTLADLVEALGAGMAPEGGLSALFDLLEGRK